MQAVSSQAQDVLEIRYRFEFDNGDKENFIIRLDSHNLTPVDPPPAKQPDWTLLDHKKCPHCPLASEAGRRCPLSARIVELADRFRSMAGHGRVDVRVETPERTYLKRCSIHEALAALLGIYMVTSECPVMAQLKPMIRYHLPFSTTYETMSRVASWYLLQQYFRSEKGQAPDWNLEDLARIYREIHMVNVSIADRLVDAEDEDASRNAAIHLDAFASLMTMAIEEGSVDETVHELIHSPLGPA